MKTLRTVQSILEPQTVIEGEGAHLRRAFDPGRDNPLDPFLLFDHFSFDGPPDVPLFGFPTHPHRGIETVTYMLEGSIRHRDSLGNVGVISAGDIQWMTSGRGILHEEMPKRGPAGRVNGFQLWVNLPAAKKMTQPRYQEISAEDIPTVELDDVRVRIVAGEFAGVEGPVIDIAARPTYMDITLEPGTAITLPASSGHSAVAYVFDGEGLFGVTGDTSGTYAQALSMIVFSDGDCMQIEASPARAVRFMLMTGAPFKEPIFAYGPFVMNTLEEIIQAYNDLRNGTFIQD